MRLAAILAGLVVAASLAAVAAAATVRGTSRADVLRGTPRADRLFGLAGNDLLDARAGRDLIVAGRGNDRVVAWDGVGDRISCGPGSDLVNAEARDSAAPDCELVVRQISADPYRNAVSQHETEVEPDTFAFGSTVVAAFQVGRIINGGAANTGFATSQDGGRTWRNGVLPGLTTASGGRFERATDPAVAYDATHGVWMITSLLLSPGDGPAAIVLSRSSDGLRWDSPVIVSASGDFAYDKQWLTCDNWPTSPFRGGCYMAYSDLHADQLAVQTSADGGLTWSGPVYPPNAAGRAGINSPVGAPAPQPLVRPDGTLVIPYFDDDVMASVRSADGGATFSRPAPIAPVRFARTAIRAGPLPSGEADAAGTLYLVWPDCRFRSGCAGDDLVLVRSPDGVSWSAPVRISTGAAGAVSHVIPGLAAGAAGKLALAYYRVAGERLEVAFVSSPDGGATWTRPRTLSAERFTTASIAATTLGPMVGDYISTSFVDGAAVPVFALARRADRRLHEAMFSVRLGVP